MKTIAFKTIDPKALAADSPVALALTQPLESPVDFAFTKVEAAAPEKEFSSHSDRNVDRTCESFSNSRSVHSGVLLDVIHVLYALEDLVHSDLALAVSLGVSLNVQLSAESRAAWDESHVGMSSSIKVDATAVAGTVSSGAGMGACVSFAISVRSRMPVGIEVALCRCPIAKFPAQRTFAPRQCGAALQNIQIMSNNTVNALLLVRGALEITTRAKMRQTTADFIGFRRLGIQITVPTVGCRVT